MNNRLQINFKPTGQLFSGDLSGLSASQLNSILEPIGLTIMRKGISLSPSSVYDLSDNQSMLRVDSSGIVLLGPIDLVPSAEPILKLAKSLSLEVSDVRYSHSKFISGNTQPEPHHPGFDEEVSVLNGLFPHLKAQVSDGFFVDHYLAYDGMEAPHPVSGSSGSPSRIALNGPIDPLPAFKPIQKRAKSGVLGAFSDCFSPPKSFYGNTRPKPAFQPIQKRAKSGVLGAFSDCFSPRKSIYGNTRPKPAFQPIQKRATSRVLGAFSDYFSRRKSIYGNTRPKPHPPRFLKKFTYIVDEEATKVKLPCPVIGSGGLKFKQIKCGSGMKDSRNLHDMIVIKIDENHKVFNIYVLNHVINKSLSENHHFEVKNRKYYSVKRNIDRILTGNGCKATGYVNNADDYGYLFLRNGGNVSNASGIVLADFIVNGNVTCADNGAFHNTGIPNVGMNNGYGGNRSRVRGINAGQNGHPMYNGNGNGGGNVPNGGSDMLPGDDIGNYISINRRLNEGNGVAPFTPVGHIVLQNGDGFRSFIHKVHCQWARYENKTPFEDGEVDAFTAWPGYRIRYMGTVEGYELDGMVELEVPGWSWEVFADRLEEIIVEREDEEA